MTTYAIIPLIALSYAVWRWRSGKPKAFRPVVSVLVMAILLGVGLNVAYAVVAGAKVRVAQVLLLSYLLLAIILLLRGLNQSMAAGVQRLLRVRVMSPGPIYALAALATVLRVAFLACIGLPFVMSAIMTFRPKVKLADDPQQQIGHAFETVEFDSSDGVTIQGWWMPSGKTSTETVIVCHGLGANKSNQLSLASHFTAAGFNVLIFDFRAHGHSGGQISSFGDFERRDVLAAVKWVRSKRPAHAKSVYGVGASMGAAALIAAAAGDSPEALAIDAIAVYGTYDSLPGLAGDIARRSFIPPFDWLVIHVAMPFASLHAGTDLTAFAPATLIDRVAPRPAMFIHGTADVIIPFDRGQSLYDAASQPKQYLWIKDGDHNGIINDQKTGRMVAEFFRTATSAL